MRRLLRLPLLAFFFGLVYRYMDRPYVAIALTIAIVQLEGHHSDACSAGSRRRGGVMCRSDGDEVDYYVSRRHYANPARSRSRTRSNVSAPASSSTSASSSRASSSRKTASSPGAHAGVSPRRAPTAHATPSRPCVVRVGWFSLSATARRFVLIQNAAPAE